MRKKVEVKAIYDQDLDQVLRNLGIMDKLIAEELTCVVCGCQVGLDNLGAIFMHGDETGVSCDNDRCIRIVTTREAATLNGNS